MKLFYQLTQTDQDNALHHCADIVLDDLIEEGVKLEPITEDDSNLKERLEAAVQHIKTLPTREEKENYFMNDSFLSKSIYEIALEMAKSAFYHSGDELVIYPDALVKVKEEVEEEYIAPLPTPKKDHSLN